MIRHFLFHHLFHFPIKRESSQHVEDNPEEIGSSGDVDEHKESNSCGTLTCCSINTIDEHEPPQHFISHFSIGRQSGLRHPRYDTLRRPIEKNVTCEMVAKWKRINQCVNGWCEMETHIRIKLPTGTFFSFACGDVDEGIEPPIPSCQISLRV